MEANPLAGPHPSQRPRPPPQPLHPLGRTTSLGAPGSPPQTLLVGDPPLTTLPPLWALCALSPPDLSGPLFPPNLSCHHHHHHDFPRHPPPPRPLQYSHPGLEPTKTIQPAQPSPSGPGLRLSAASPAPSACLYKHVWAREACCADA